MNSNKNLTKSILILLIGVMILGFTSLLAIGLSNQTSATGRSGAVLIGKEPPRFIAPIIDSSEKKAFASINDFSENVLVLNFWASWCPPCRDETPGFQRLYKKYENKGVSFSRNLGITLSNSKYIAFIDSDDYWAKDKLADQIFFMETFNYEFTYTDYTGMFWVAFRCSTALLKGFVCKTAQHKKI